MSKDTIKKDLTIKWIQNKHKLVCFKEEEDSYDYLDNVEQYLGNIKEGDLVEVMIDKDNNVVCVKKKAGSETKETVSNVKTETAKKEDDNKVENWTVKAFTTARDVVKFEESKVSWYMVPEESDREKLANVRKGDTIKVIIGVVEEKGKEKPAIRSITLVESKKEETVKAEEKQESTKGAYNPPPKNENQASRKVDSTTSSIERQVILKESGAIVRSLIEHGSNDVNSVPKIGNVIKELAKYCSEALNQ